MGNLSTKPAKRTVTLQLPLALARETKTLAVLESPKLDKNGLVLKAGESVSWQIVCPEELDPKQPVYLNVLVSTVEKTSKAKLKMTFQDGSNKQQTGAVLVGGAVKKQFVALKVSKALGQWIIVVDALPDNRNVWLHGAWMTYTTY